MSNKPPKTPLVKPRTRQESVKKWTKTVLAPGFTILPTVLLERQAELDLDAVDMNILLHLIGSWWKADRPPWLAKATLAGRIGVDPSTVRRHIAAMEKRKLLRRRVRRDTMNGQRSNDYDLKGLVDRLHPLAVDVVKKRKEKRRARGGAA